mgnify:CR=1 FL=1
MQTSLAEAKIYLENLDLSYISNLMCSLHYVLPRWSKKEAEFCAQLYKNFLWLNKKYGAGNQLVPTKEIDEFWHNHILYTQNFPYFF